MLTQCKKHGSRWADGNSHLKTCMLEAKKKVNDILTKKTRDEVIEILKEFDGTLISIETPYGQ